MAGPDIPSNDSSSGRRFALIALLLIGAVAGGVAVRKWMQAGRRQPATLARTGASPVPSAGLSLNAAALWNRLLSVLGLPGAGRFGFDRLAALLLGHKNEALAAAFAADFMKEPELKKIWDEFEARHDDVNANAAWLARQLSDSNAFAALLNRCAKDPRFVAVGDSLAREMSAAVVQSGSPEVTGGKALTLGDGPAPGHKASAVASAGPQTSSLMKAWSPTNAERVPVVAAGGGETGEESAGTEASSNPTSTGSAGGFNVTALGKVKSAGPDMDAAQYIASLCLRHDPVISYEQCEAIKKYLGPNGLWDSCRLAGELSACINVCLTKPEAGCAKQARDIQACLKTGATPSSCTSGCANGRECKPQCPKGYKLMGARGCLPSCGQAGGKHCLAGKSCKDSGGTVPVGVDTWDCGIASCCR
ncbi:MAG: hypothetical protein NTX64_02635 [Elusimicrobia bacterium]|nr:hypothetical protein [Elusimicrobiota bacterium]